MNNDNTAVLSALSTNNIVCLQLKGNKSSIVTQTVNNLRILSWDSSPHKQLITPESVWILLLNISEWKYLNAKSGQVATS